MRSLYSKSYGPSSCKVRVYEPRRGANFMLARRVAGKYHTKTLGHRDAEQAEKDAHSLINAVLSGAKEKATSSDPDKLTVKTLVSLYLESESFRALKPRSAKERERLLIKAVDWLGPTKRVATLDTDDTRGLLRRQGGGNTNQYHLFAALRAVVMWGTEKKLESGAALVRHNPLQGVAKRLGIRPNPMPNRPVITEAMFVALRRGNRKRASMMLRVCLAICYETGRRIGEIRAIPWQDFDLDAGRIYWDGSRNKRGYGNGRPMSKRVRRYLRVWQAHCPSSELVFPGTRNPNQPVPRDTSTKWPRIMFRNAGMKKPKGLGFHGTRRGWASARRGHALADIREAGGWRSNEVVLGYIQTTEADVDRVVLTPTHRV